MPRQHPIQKPPGHNSYLIRVIISDSHRCARLLLCFIFVFWAKKDAHPQLANERIILYSLHGRCRWCSASHNLRIQATALGRTQADDTVNGRAIPAFRQEHRVRQRLVLAIVKPFQNVLPVRRCAIDFCGLEVSLIEDITQSFADSYQRRKDDSLSVLAFSHNGIRNRVQIQVKNIAEVLSTEITGIDMNLADVYLDRNCLRVNFAEISFPNCIRELILNLPRLKSRASLQFI